MANTTIANAQKTSMTQVKLVIDCVLLVSFILVNMPQATGLAFHEWASFLFVVPLSIHLILNWAWIVKVSKRLFTKLPTDVRLNHFWDLLIYVLMVIVMFTGVIVSESALPSLGIHFAIDPFWQSMHDITANLLIIFIGVHLALHWKWIVSAFNRYVRGKR